MNLSLYHFCPCVIFLINAVLLLKLSLYNAHLTISYVEGSLSRLWTLNFTVFLENLEGNLLYCADFERNNLMISFGQIQKPALALVLKYNKEIKSINLKSLCGCDPCKDELVNFYLNSESGHIRLICNMHGQFTLQKVDIVGRRNDDIPIAIRDETTNPNKIYASIALDKVGCLESFYYNTLRINFTSFGQQFIPTCARRCFKGACNGGKCRALIGTGPKCNCSSTALNGPSCKDRLKEYKGSLVNSYKIKNNKDVGIKLSWKQVLYKRYCLLEFIHRHGRIVLSIDDTFLLRGSDIVSNIDSDVINFISVRIIDNVMTIKVNNILKNFQLALFGEIYVNVGFTENHGECDTFEGVYDFIYEPTQLERILRVSSTPSSTIAHPSIPPSTNIVLSTVYSTNIITSHSSQYRAVLLGFGSAIIIMLLVGAVVAITIWIKKYRCKEGAAEIDNIYFSEHKNVDSQTPYESLNSDDVFMEKYNANARSNGRDTHRSTRGDNPLPLLPTINSDE